MAWFKKSSVDGKIDGPIDMIKEADSVSRPMAIMVVIAIILLTASVIFCLFVGGRWLYHQIKPSKSTNTPAASNKPDNESPANQPATTPPASTPAQSSNNNSNSTKPATVPSSGPSQLPNSGPDPSQP